ncbi:hypothetical protein L2E82_32447 [Cichorium intybus]|uniref:Uncharacterized protein n=1 Tax=Cichorium intybus TaxID=13427 RepID=A0ACB9BI06_CICIN|nr:hypothetical protein L2E82_32447 [Cichorium intybus]
MVKRFEDDGEKTVGGGDVGEEAGYDEEQKRRGGENQAGYKSEHPHHSLVTRLLKYKNQKPYQRSTSSSKKSNQKEKEKSIHLSLHHGTPINGRQYQE